MRRAAAQTISAARRAPVWRVAGRRPRVGFFSSAHALNLRPSPFVGRHRYVPFIPATLHSSMHLRNFSLALISTAVASGAWYAYHGGASHQSVVKSADGPSSSQLRSIATGVPPVAHAEEPSDNTRKALLVHNDYLYTTTLPEDGPLAKQTDDSDRRILGMLTPEQAAQKLRKNEESYMVNRGKGVVRYDIVQVPSNTPIEDDHSEKIIEVPSSVAATMDGEANSDWMFWAVFDGHS